jgi:hypothetical protein
MLTGHGHEKVEVRLSGGKRLAQSISAESPQDVPASSGDSHY